MNAYELINENDILEAFVNKLKPEFTGYNFSTYILGRNINKALFLEFKFVDTEFYTREGILKMHLRVPKSDGIRFLRSEFTRMEQFLISFNYTINDNNNNTYRVLKFEPLAAALPESSFNDFLFKSRDFSVFLTLI